MSKTLDLGVTITCENEDDYDRATDAIMDTISKWSGAMSGQQWDSIAEDES